MKSPELLKAVLQLYPLDQYVDQPVALMDRVPSDKERRLKVPIWEEYQKIVDLAENKKVFIRLNQVAGIPKWNLKRQIR